MYTARYHRCCSFSSVSSFNTPFQTRLNNCVYLGCNLYPGFAKRLDAKAELCLCFVSSSFVSLHELFPLHLDPDAEALVHSRESLKSRPAKAQRSPTPIYRVIMPLKLHSKPALVYLVYLSLFPFFCLPLLGLYITFWWSSPSADGVRHLHTLQRSVQYQIPVSDPRGLSSIRSHAHGFTRSWGLCFGFQMHTDVCVQCEVHTWIGWRYVNSFVALALWVLGQVPQL